MTAPVTLRPAATGASGSPRAPLENADLRLSNLGLERIALIFSALAVSTLPVLRPTGPLNTAPLDAMVLLAVGTTFVWGALARWPFRIPFAIAGGVVIGTGALAAVFGRYPSNGLVAIAADFLLLMWAATVVNVAHTPEKLRTIVRTWALTSVAWAGVLATAVAMGNHALAGITEKTGTRASLTFGDPNVAASYFSVSIFIVWAARCPSWRGLRILAYTLLATAVLLTGSNGGIGGLLLGTTAVSLVRISRRSGLPAAVAVGGLALVLVISVGRIDLAPFVQRAQRSGVPWLQETAGRADDSTSERAQVLSESYGLFLEGGLLGQGPGSTKPRMEAALASYPKEVHNDYVGSLIERGALGVLGLLLLIGSLGVRTLQVVDERRPRYAASAIPRPLGLLGAGVVCLSSATVYEILHFRHVWTLFAVIAAACIWESQCAERAR